MNTVKEITKTIIVGELNIWQNEGGFSSPTVMIDDSDLSMVIAEMFGVSYDSDTSRPGCVRHYDDAGLGRVSIVIEKK